VSVDRHAILRRAEQFVRQGRTALAIEEYLRVLDDRPTDWSTANALGDLYVREHQQTRAVEQFVRGADVLLAEGFAARAAALYRKALRCDPRHAHALARLAETSSEPRHADVGPRPRTDAGPEEEGEPVHAEGVERAVVDPHAIHVDLLEVPDVPIEVIGLEAPSEEAAPPLEDIFAGFREEAAMEESGGAAEAALARGRILQAAGQVDEAVRELERAARAPHLRFESASLLARIYRDRGWWSEGVEWFERATEAPAPTDADGHRLLYELASALEAAGEPRRALAVYLELEIAAGRYEDVADRVRRLQMVEDQG
jgi:tetratricopeptide (TPR) repeat protein